MVTSVRVDAEAEADHDVFESSVMPQVGAWYRASREAPVDVGGIRVAPAGLEISLVVGKIPRELCGTRQSPEPNHVGVKQHSTTTTNAERRSQGPCGTSRQLPLKGSSLVSEKHSGAPRNRSECIADGHGKPVGEEICCADDRRNLGKRESAAESPATTANVVMMPSLLAPCESVLNVMAGISRAPRGSTLTRYPRLVRPYSNASCLCRRSLSDWRIWCERTANGAFVLMMTELLAMPVVRARSRSTTEGDDAPRIA